MSGGHDQPDGVSYLGPTLEAGLARVREASGKASLSPEPTPAPEKRVKGCYIGAPAVFALELACKQMNAAFGVHACYQVGSSLEGPGWRDVDVRMIMDDGAFAALFPDAADHWEHDERWLLMTVALSERLSRLTGLPIDFQFQPRTHANDRFRGRPRNALGLRFAKEPAP